MNYLQPSVRNLQEARTARDMERVIATTPTPFPKYVHKWTRERRVYALQDLSLPDVIFCRGIWPNWDAPIIGVGGTRTPTVETFCLVSSVIREISKSGAIVVSGGVPGVDLAAHLAVLDCPGGTTVAVLANPVESGLRGHEWFSDTLEEKLLAQGAFLSEYSVGCDVGSSIYCERLLARDRIISGLSDVFVVFECSECSATVDTARRAIVQGKQIVCVRSGGKSSRFGLDQLAAEFHFSVLDGSLLSVSEIAASVLRACQASPPLLP